MVGLTRRILIFPKGNNVKQLSVYLEVVDASDLPFLWTRYAEFSLTVVNQLNSNKSITKGIFFTVRCC